MSTYMVRVLDGLARLLGTLPQLTYREDGSAYKPGENPVTFGRQHPTADTCVAVTPYLDNPQAAHVTFTHVQVRTRCPDYLDGLALVDSIRDLMHDRRYVDLGGVVVSRLRLYSFIPMGPDENGRHEWSQNFQLMGARAPQLYPI